MLRRVVQVVFGVVAAWLIALAVLGEVYDERTGRGIAQRLGRSLEADAKIGGTELSLVTGRVALERIAVRRADAVGKLALDVARVDCDLPPLGLALLDRECSELSVRGVRLDVSTAALFKLRRPKQSQIRAQRVVIDDAVLVFAPSAILPSLGRIEIAIEHAVAGPTTFRTPLSWVFAMRELRAALALPAGITLHLRYANGVLGASGSVLGGKPVELPLALPVVEASDDARSEIGKLVEFGTELAQRLVARRATDWVKSKLR